jgi:chromate reductase
VFDVVGIAGSLRRGSFNRALLQAAAEGAPRELRITTHEIGDLPLYNAEVESSGMPPAVSALRDRVRRADGVLIATPEYNHGVPGVLKNAIDWLYRPPRGSALDGKAAAIMGASPGMDGNGLQPR